MSPYRSNMVFTLLQLRWSWLVSIVTFHDHILSLCFCFTAMDSNPFKDSYPPYAFSDTFEMQDMSAQSYTRPVLNINHDYGNYIRLYGL